MGKKKKSSKKKDHKKKKHRSRMSSQSSSSDSSSSSARKTGSGSDRETNKQPVLSFLDPKSKKLENMASWHLSQKSETLIFDDHANDDKGNSETFVWRKKNAKIGLDKYDPKDLILMNKLKQDETQRELEKLKKRKIEREREKEEREREREFLQRQKETEYHKEWEKQEDSFHLKQVKLRSKIRIEEGRAKPIDLLAKYISAEDDNLAIEMHEPYTFLNGLTIRDLEDLLADIEVYSTYEQGANVDYWRDITIVTEDELKKLQLIDKNSREHVGDRREGINQSVLQDVSSLLKGKTYEQLITLEESIKKKINEESGIDIGYWESLLAQLKAHMARARLKERHQKVLVKKLETLKKQQGIVKSKEPEYKPSTSKSSKSSVKAPEPEKYKNKDEINIDDDDEEEDDFDRQEKADERAETLELDQLTIAVREYESGRYSPVLLQPADLPVDAFMFSQEEYDSQLEQKRAQVLGTGAIKPDVEDEFEARARENMGDFVEDGGPAPDPDAKPAPVSAAQEITIDHHYNWSDKYRPRKPRYYNRVHTGYDWNQYNKKHYDVDNPPPKTVQGYKFNIFYPDLIDKTQTPKYSIKACADNRDFAILRFHAGPPYEDVAFKIVNREWDISYKHGFRNQFQNGIYQLWFHFRKWKYRR